MNLDNIESEELTLSKKCTKCKRLKTYDNFYKCNKVLSGLSSQCKECVYVYKSNVNNSPPNDLTLDKICTKCKKVKTCGDFHINKTHVDGLSNNCKMCVKLYQDKINKLPPSNLSLTKTCTKCKKVKTCGDFHKNKRGVDGLYTQCKECKKKYKIIHNNSTSIDSNMSKKCTCCKIVKKCIYFHKSSNMSDGFKSRCKKCVKQNNENNRKQNNENRRKRREKDLLFRLSSNIRSHITTSIKNIGYSKNSKTCEILGCEFGEFMLHLNSNKYNFTYGDNLCDIDHIIPLSSATTEEEIYKLNHYTNFQLLSSYYNRYIKRDNVWDEENFKEWFIQNINVLNKFTHKV